MRGFVFILLGLLVSCAGSKDQYASSKKTKWKKLDCGLYTDKDGNIAFCAHEGMNPDKHEGVGEEFITHFGWQDTTQLKNIIDLNTFEELRMGFYKDKNRIYYHYDMSDGGYFEIWTEDLADFEMRGNYVLYKGRIHYPRYGEVDADFNTFKTSDELGPYGKDKDGYFEYEKRKSIEEIKKHIPPANLEKLLKL